MQGVDKRLSHCPLCSPTTEDRIVIRSSRALAVCDAMPAMLGHILVAPISHCPSVLDLSPPDREHVRIVEQEIGQRLYLWQGDWGHYEHGRSLLCRFHTISPPNLHAHVHSLPYSFDLVHQSDDATEEGGPAVGRYLYQRTRRAPEERYAAVGTETPRHVVRSTLERVLREAGRVPISLEESADVHDNAVTIAHFELTRRNLRTPLRLLVLAGRRGRRVSGAVAERLSDESTSGAPLIPTSRSARRPEEHHQPSDVDGFDDGDIVRNAIVQRYAEAAIHRRVVVHEDAGPSDDAPDILVCLGDDARSTVIPSARRVFCINDQGCTDDDCIALITTAIAVASYRSLREK
jgi:diadenosine tetraphosphate (Ap4A) HIT family hydrolase